MMYGAIYGVIYIILLCALIILAWGYFGLLKHVERQAKEISELRFYLFQAESKIAIYEFGMELNKKTLEAFQGSQVKEEIELVKRSEEE